MKSILLITMLAIIGSPQQFKFGKNEVNNWVVVLDGVMGGRSTGELSFTDHALVMQGDISLENNGGFASVRSPWGQYDLSEAEGIKMKVKGDGRKYTVMLEPTNQWYLPTYVVDVKTSKKWKTIDIPMSELRYSQVGRRMDQKPTAEDLAQVKRIGFILFDKQSGPYTLEVESLEFY